jgi:hypothetical protein
MEYKILPMRNEKISNKLGGNYMHFKRGGPNPHEVKKKDLMKKHIKEHVSYPTTKKALVEACNMMSDVPKWDKDWFEKNLPDKEYKTAEEVMKALNL